MWAGNMDNKNPQCSETEQPAEYYKS